MNTLRAGALRLEPLIAAHAAEMFAVLSDPAIYEFENEPPASVAALRQRFARLESRRSPDGSEQWLNWVVRQPEGEAAGYLQATVLPDGRAYVAYELGSRFWRQGIASAALEAVLHELATSYGVREAYAVLKAANFRSLGLLRKLGFSPLSPVRSAVPGEPGKPGAAAGPVTRAGQAPWTQEADEVTCHRTLHAQASTAPAAHPAPAPPAAAAAQEPPAASMTSAALRNASTAAGKPQ